MSGNIVGEIVIGIITLSLLKGCADGVKDISSYGMDQRGKNIAECSLEAEKAKMSFFDSTVHMTICMKARGYDYVRDSSGCKGKPENESFFTYDKCYSSDGFIRRMIE